MVFAALGSAMAGGSMSKGSGGSRWEAASGAEQRLCLLAPAALRYFTHVRKINFAPRIRVVPGTSNLNMRWAPVPAACVTDGLAWRGLVPSGSPGFWVWAQMEKAKAAAGLLLYSEPTNLARPLQSSFLLWNPLFHGGQGGFGPLLIHSGFGHSWSAQHHTDTQWFSCVECIRSKYFFVCLCCFCAWLTIKSVVTIDELIQESL